jgi:hypothetical protein
MKRHCLPLLAMYVLVIVPFAAIAAPPAWAPPVPLPTQVPTHPTDPGRLSLLQVHNGQLLNMRDNSTPNYASINFVDGRTRFNQASSIFLPGGIRVAIEQNLTLDAGTVAFWVQKADWASVTDDWFFRVDIAGPYPFIDNFQVRKWVDGRLYWGFERHRGVYPVSQLDPDDWHLIVVTWEFGNRMRLYVNGEFKQEISLPTATIGNTLPYFCWGQWGGLDCKCAEEDMQTFNYALTAEQVVDMYDDRFPARFYGPGP